MAMAIPVSPDGAIIHRIGQKAKPVFVTWRPEKLTGSQFDDKLKYVSG
jgi:hypothetical protein